jgi:dihydrodipicolinate synthase/N-acetylneuraminate lyase
MLTAPALRGFTPVLATPLREDETVDAEALSELVHSTRDSGPAAVQILGSTGQGASLGPAEHEQAISVAVEALEGSMPLVAGVSGRNTAEIVRATEAASAGGASAVLVPATSYYPLGDDDVRRLYQRVGDASPVPVLMYNIPARTGVTITPDVAIELAAHPNIFGMKDSSGNMAAFASIAAGTSGTDFALLQGRVALVLASMAVGGTGWMTTVGNVEPSLDAALLQALGDADDARARACQERMLKWAALFNHGGWDPATNVTALLSLAGRCKNVMAEPVHVVQGDELEALAARRERLLS